MKRWKDNWDAISPIFKFSTTVRTVIYTTIPEFYLPETESPEKRISKRYSSIKGTVSCYIWSYKEMKWTSTIRNWAQVYGELSIMYEGRLPE